MALNRDEFQNLFHQIPFRPFDIRTSTGKTITIDEPRRVILMQSDFFFAFPGNERWTVQAYTHASFLEPHPLN